MSGAIYWLAGLFLPVFPLSMLFNFMFNKVHNVTLRALLLLLWPQLGLSLALATAKPPPQGFVSLALFTSALYAFRAISLREVGQWIGYLATSGWVLLWVALANHTSPEVIRLYALGFSTPLVLLAMLGRRLETQFGAAFTGLYGGLAQSIPRTAGVMACVVLAVVAVPLSPSFFAMLAIVVASTPAMPWVALAIMGIWVFWTWAGVRVLQGLIIGPVNGAQAQDLGPASTWAYALVLAALLGGGLYLAGGAL